MLFGLFNPSQHSALLFSDVIFCYQHQEKESIANKQYGICVTIHTKNFLTVKSK